MISLFDAISPADLITAISGTTNGINWTIESVFERRAGFRLFIDGRWLATLPSPGAARELREWWFEENETDAVQASVETGV